MIMRYKLLVAFVGALTVSATIFLLFSYYSLHSGYFSGVSRDDMKKALAQGEMLLTEMDEETLRISRCEMGMSVLQVLEADYKDMDFAVLDSGNWETIAKIPVILDEAELLSAINGQNESCGEYVVAATAVRKESHTSYLICFVNRTQFEAMSYEFNMPRARGILGKLAVVGVVITLIIVGVAIYIIQREYEEKERLEKSRKELISNLSHDLRTPLSSVLGYSEMLKNGIYDDETEKQQYIDIIHRKSVYMEKLLSELLEYSRLELGTMRLQKQKMDITELIREVLIEYLPELEKNQYELVLEIPEESITGNWDKEKLGRVFRNLMDNALKYGMDGKKLRIAVEKREQQVSIEIQDFGKGIPEKEIPHVTKQFYRADHARNSKQGGMGLGLFIVQEIIKLHGGNFSIESKEQQGMKAGMRIPIER